MIGSILPVSTCIVAIGLIQSKRRLPLISDNTQVIQVDLAQVDNKYSDICLFCVLAAWSYCGPL